MDHGRQSAWTFHLIICILYNKQYVIQCSGINCYPVNGRLDNTSTDINSLHLFIIQLHGGQYSSSGVHLHKDYNGHKLNNSEGIFDIFKFHHCCKLFLTFNLSKTLCILTHPGNFVISVSQLKVFLRINIFKLGHFRFLYNLCHMVWTYSGVKSYYSFNNFYLLRNLLTMPAGLKFHTYIYPQCVISNGNIYCTENQNNNLLATFLFSNNSRERNAAKKANNVSTTMCNDSNCNEVHRHTRQVICEPFLFGQSCSHECHCAQLRPCNTTEGHCPFDLCYLGWQRPNCSVRSCNTDSFIIYPKGECRPCGCKSGTTCNILTGECDRQCESEPDCSRQTCQRHMFSPPNCNKKCNCRAQSECHPVTGECRMESCSQSDVNPPTCSRDLGDGHLWETASALMILSSFFLIKFITFLIY